MKKYVNGKYVEMTADEVSAMKTEAKRYTLTERTRPLTESEVSRLIIADQINTLAVDDNTALRMREFYPAWEAGKAYAADYKVQYGGKLYKVIAAHTSQTDWTPDISASLYTVINETHEGTADDPIPYDGNMALEAGKHYMQDYVVYLCTANTGNPVYNPLAELAGLYVEAV